jgi:hypothetical protein
LATLAIVLALAIPATGQAAWFGYRNDTTRVMVVQTSVTMNGRLIRGKAHVLYPGEMAWDNMAAPGLRTITVFDPKANNRVVAQENIFIQNQDVFLSAQMRPVPQLPGRPAQPPVLRLIPARPPGPAGVIPPKPTNPAPLPGVNPAVPPRGPLPPTAQPQAPPTPAPKSDPPPSKSG